MIAIDDVMNISSPHKKKKKRKKTKLEKTWKEKKQMCALIHFNLFRDCCSVIVVVVFVFFFPSEIAWKIQKIKEEEEIPPHLRETMSCNDAVMPCREMDARGSDQEENDLTGTSPFFFINLEREGENKTELFLCVSGTYKKNNYRIKYKKGEKERESPLLYKFPKFSHE